MEFALELGRVLKASGLSQNKLSQAIGMSSTHVSNMMNSKRRPSRETLDRIVAKLKLSETSASRLRRAVAKDMGLH